MSEECSDDWIQQIHLDYYDDCNYNDEYISYHFNQSEDKNDLQILNDKNELDDEKAELNQLYYFNHSASNIHISDQNQKNELKKKIKRNTYNYSCQKMRKRKLDLSQQAQYLKNNLYLIFTDKKKFPKTIIKKIHYIIQKPLNLKPMSRETVRFNDKYFEVYASESKNIIQYLLSHKEEILELIPELKQYS